MVGGETQERSFRLLKPDGILVSVVSPLPEESRPGGRRSVFFLVDVTTARLNTLTNSSTAANSRLPLVRSCLLRKPDRLTKCSAVRRTHAAKSFSQCRTSANNGQRSRS